MNKTIDALLISAGYSGRMGDFKPLIKINDKSFVEIIIEKLLLVCNKVVIVTGFRNVDLENEISLLKKKKSAWAEKVICIYNENYYDGMFTSIKKGIDVLQNSSWVLFHFVDQPLIPKEFYYELINQIDENYEWVQPVYNFTYGHPVVFNNKIISMVSDAPKNFRMKLIRDNDNVKKKFWLTNYKEILQDIDTKEDLENYVENQ